MITASSTERNPILHAAKPVSQYKHTRIYIDPAHYERALDLIDLLSELAHYETNVHTKENQHPSAKQMSMQDYAQYTAEGRAEYTKAMRQAANKGMTQLALKELNEHMQSAYKLWRVANGVVGANHGLVRKVRPLTYLIGDLLSYLIDIAGNALEKELNAKLAKFKD